jgi:hypothetical protein
MSREGDKVEAEDGNDLGEISLSLAFTEGGLKD